MSEASAKSTRRAHAVQYNPAGAMFWEYEDDKKEYLPDVINREFSCLAVGVIGEQ